MLSPARKHFQRVTAAKAAGTARPNEPQTGEQFEIFAAALWEARRTLKTIKSTQAKVDKKREMLPDFDPYIQGVLDGGNGAQDSVLMTMMVWRIDVGDLTGALDIGEYAVKHNLDTPDQFDRDTVSLLAEEIADTAARQLSESEDSAPALVEILERTAAVVDGHDMHDQIKAKLHKSTGYAHRIAGNLAAALEQLKQAVALNERAGVKQDIQQLEKQLKNAGEQATA